MSKIATMTFQSKGGNTYTVEVYKRNAEAVNYVLTPAATPFETEENNSNDPLEPVRGSTGYMRFVYDGGMNGDGEPYFVDFIAADATEIQVALRDDADVILWQGYVKPSQYSQSYDTTIREISVPIVSGLEVLDAIEMDAANVNASATWRELLDEAITQAGLQYTAVVVPYEWGTVWLDSELVTSGIKDFNYTAPFLTKASRWVWFSATNAKNDNDPNWREFEGKSYGEMLADWCKFWGWSVHERGQVLYFVSRRTTVYCRLDYALFETDTSLEDLEPTDIIKTTVDTQGGVLTDAMLDGTGHTFKAEPGVRTVEIDADTQEIETEVLGISTSELQYLAHRNSHFNPQFIEIQLEYWINASILAYGPELGKIEAWHRVNVWNAWEANTETDWKNFVTNPTSEARIEMPTSGVYSGYVKIDFFNNDEKEDKKNYSYKEGFMLYNALDYDISYEGRLDEWKAQYNQPIFRLTGRKSVSLKSGSGYLAVNMNLAVLNYSFRTNYKTWNVTIKIGNKVWTGEEWTTTLTHDITSPSGEETVTVPWSVPITFDMEDTSTTTPYSMTDNNTVDDKTLDMDCNGAAGYLIPVNTELEGIPEITIYPIYKNHHFILLENIGIDFYPALGEENKDRDATNKYYSNTGATGTETKKVALNLATINNNNPGYGLLKYDQDVANGTTFRTPAIPGTTSAETARPEEVLLSVARDCYGARKMELDMVVGMDHRERPIDRYTRAEWSGYWLPVAESIDWAEDRRTLTLLEK